MLYKESRFNFWAGSTRGRYLLLNGVSGALYEMSEHERGKALEFLRVPFDPGRSGDASLAATLLAGKFAIPSSFDEVAALHRRAEIECANPRIWELEICPTYECNFRCGYCYVRFSPGRMTESVEQRVVRHIEAGIPRYRQLQVSWIGGEPLLCADTVWRVSAAIARLANHHGVLLANTLLTNGYLLNLATARRLYEAGVAFFHVTIDGTAEHHDKLRVLRGGGRTRDVLMGNVLAILENLPHVRVNLRVNVNERNAEAVPTLLDEISPSLRQQIQVNICPISTAHGCCGGLESSTAGDLYRRINQLLRKAILDGYRCSNSQMPLFRPTYCSADKQQNFQIGPDGVLSKCNPTRKPEARVGHLNERGMAVLNGSNETWHRAPVFGDRCAECRYLCFCGGGCRVGRLRGVQGPNCRLRFDDLENMIINRSLLVPGGSSSAYYRRIRSQ